MTEITEKEYLILMQKFHLELIEWAKKELSLIPKEIQKINDRTRIHIKQLMFDLEAIEKNCKIISLHRAKKESGMKLNYNVEKGNPSFGEVRRKKPKKKKLSENGERLYQ